MNSNLLCFTEGSKFQRRRELEDGPSPWKNWSQILPDSRNSRITFRRSTATRTSDFGWLSMICAGPRNPKYNEKYKKYTSEFCFFLHLFLFSCVFSLIFLCSILSSNYFLLIVGFREFLARGAPCEINIDGKTMEKVHHEMKNPSRFTFDAAQDHVYTLLLKKDCYPRFIRSEHYKNLLAAGIQPSQKKRLVNICNENLECWY